jgi:hypothetical protein
VIGRFLQRLEQRIGGLLARAIHVTIRNTRQAPFSGLNCAIT